MQIIDVITYNGEKELFDIRYNILKDYVDEFIVVEFPTTFSGRHKPYYFKEIQDKYEKVKYWTPGEVEHYTEDETRQAEESPNTQGASHWKHEFLQKESIKKALTHLKDDDIVFIGDCDEIWNPRLLSEKKFWDKREDGRVPNYVYKLSQYVYVYYLNNLSSEKWWGTIVCRYKYIKDKCLNHARTTGYYQLGNQYETVEDDVYGWHFTSMGGYEEVKRKLTDSYTTESYANEVVMENLEHNIVSSKDFLGRDFTYTIDEVDLPQYLKDNKDKYEHLFA